MEEKIKRYVFRAEVSKIFSENSYLKPGRTRKGSSYLYLSPQARRYKEKLIEQFTEQMKKNGFPYGKAFPFMIVYEFHIIEDRDVTNMIKVTEDAFSEAIGVDDSVWRKIMASKHFIGRDVHGVPESKEVVIIKAYCHV